MSLLSYLLYELLPYYPSFNQYYNCSTILTKKQVGNFLAFLNNYSTFSLKWQKSIGVSSIFSLLLLVVKRREGSERGFRYTKNTGVLSVVSTPVNLFFWLIIPMGIIEIFTQKRQAFVLFMNNLHILRVNCAAYEVNGH